MRLVVLALAALALPWGSRADLPVHCLVQDVAGEWVFHIGPPMPRAFPDLPASIPSCGHHIPNTVTSAISVRSDVVVPAGAEERVVMNLTEDILTSPRRHLRAHGSAGGEGQWTMVFDEGFEVRAGDRSLFAHFHFEALPGAKRKPQNGDRWDSIGQYVGQKPGGKRLQPEGDLYACHCDRTSTGWWHRRNAAGALESGCLWAAKVNAAANLGNNSSPSSVVRVASAAPPSSVLTQPKLVGVRLHHSPDTVLSLADLRGNDAHKEVFFRKLPLPPRVGPSKPAKAALAALRGSDGPPLPKEWDWRRIMADLAPEGQDDLSDQFDQGNCGSCYAFSATQVLQMRFRIRLWKDHNILYPLELSWKSATQCSPYTEGCNGGFAFLGFKQAAEVGLPLAECNKDQKPASLDGECKWSCYRNNTNIFYAKDYGHTGGFAFGASEEAIMREIKENGPVIVSFSTSAVPEFIYNSGQSWNNESEVMQAFQNNKVPQETMSQNKEIRPWRYTTHSILAVGWGEETTKKGTVKYWVIRNSWGKDWGVQGYAKIRRGQNDAAIETSAPWVIPDMDRLPPGFLERARQYHQAQKASAATPAANQTDKRTAARGGGIPEYCKQRPDSPDCK